MGDLIEQPGDETGVINTDDTQFVLTFDSQDDYINFGRTDLGGVLAQGSAALTISGWVKPEQLTNKATSYGTRNVFFARASKRYSDNFELGISEEGNLDVYIDETVDNSLKTFGNGELTIGQWHFFALVFNQGELRIYLDDHDYKGTLTGATLNNASSPVTLGATLHDRIYFTGQLAHISVWNCACSPAEIQRHRDQPLVGNEPGLVAYWRLNEGQGKTVKDQTGNGYHGKFHGNPRWIKSQRPYAGIQPSNQNLSPQTTTRLVSNKPQAPETTETRKDRDKLATMETPLYPQPNPDDTQSEQTSQTDLVITNKQPEPPQNITQEESQTTMNTTANFKYKILAIDGGGIRGIIPAILLAEIEKRTQKPIFSLFDLISGTSTGGILALGLTKPRLDAQKSDSTPMAEYSAEELIQMYVEYGAEIFYEPFLEKILGPLEDLLAQPKYASDGREEIVRQYLGNTPLDQCLKEIFVTSYDIEQRIPIFFTSKLAKEETESRKFRKLCIGFNLTDAAMATSAAPTYFAPYHVATTHNPNGFYTLVDGGVIANNPAQLAIMEAKMSWQERQEILHTDEILLVSLGTGSLTSIYPYDEAKNWGLLQWARPLLNILLDGGSEVVAGQLERSMKSSNQDGKRCYYRFQTFLTSELEAMDNTQSENIRNLQALAQRVVIEKSREIDELCKILVS